MTKRRATADRTLHKKAQEAEYRSLKYIKLVEQCSTVLPYWIDRTSTAEAELSALRQQMQEQRKQVDAALSLIGPIRLPHGSDEAAAKREGFKILCKAFGFVHETHIHEVDE